jgi:hypothetical protein
MTGRRFRTVAIARGAEKADLARQLGAHHYIDSTVVDVAEELRNSLVRRLFRPPPPTPTRSAPQSAVWLPTPS